MPRKKKTETDESEVMIAGEIEGPHFDDPKDRIIYELQERVSYLTKELEYFRRDGLAGSLYALNYQLNKINEAILEANISLKGDDKQFERFWKFMTEIQEVHVTINNLQNMLFPKSAEEKEDSESNSVNIMEQLAFKNND